MRNPRVVRALSTVAGHIAAYTSIFFAAVLTWYVSAGVRPALVGEPTKTIVGIWITSAFPAVVVACVTGLLVSAYASLALTYVSRFDPVVIWAVRAWRSADYTSAVRRVRFFSWGVARRPFIALLLTAANQPERAYSILQETELPDSDIEDPTYQPEFAKGRATLAQGAYAVARSHFGRLYDRFPGTAVARYGLGDLLLWARTEPEKAHRFLTAAVKYDRSHLPHWDRLGFEAELRASYAWSLAVLGISEDFQYSFDEALRLAGQNRPVRAAVCLRLGNALEALGHGSSAREYWAAARDIDPHGSSGNIAIRILSSPHLL